MIRHEMAFLNDRFFLTRQLMEYFTQFGTQCDEKLFPATFGNPYSMIFAILG